MPVFRKLPFANDDIVAMAAYKRNGQGGDDIDNQPVDIGGLLDNSGGSVGDYATDPTTLQYGDGPGPDAQHIAHALEIGIIAGSVSIVFIGAAVILCMRHRRDSAYRRWEEENGVDTTDLMRNFGGGGGILLGTMPPQIPPIVVTRSQPAAGDDEIEHAHHHTTVSVADAAAAARVARGFEVGILDNTASYAQVAGDVIEPVNDAAAPAQAAGARRASEESSVDFVMRPRKTIFGIKIPFLRR